MGNMVSKRFCACSRQIAFECNVWPENQSHKCSELPSKREQVKLDPECIRKPNYAVQSHTKTIPARIRLDINNSEE